MSQVPSRAELDRRIAATVHCGRETRGLVSGEEILRHDMEMAREAEERADLVESERPPALPPARRVLAL